jgi:hypothetical protein
MTERETAIVSFIANLEPEGCKKTDGSKKAMIQFAWTVVMAVG